MSTPFRDAINADSPSFFLPITETSGLSLVDTVAAQNGTLSPDSGGAWTGGTMDLPGPSLDTGDKSILTNGTNGLLTLHTDGMQVKRGESLLIVIKRPADAPDSWTFGKRKDYETSGSIGYMRIVASTLMLEMHGIGNFALPATIDFSKWIVIHFERDVRFSSSNTIRCYINGAMSSTGSVTIGSGESAWLTAWGKGMSSSYSAVQVGALARFPTQLSPERIQAHYEAMVGAPLVPPGKVETLTGEANVGRTAIDWSWVAPDGAATYQFEMNGVAGAPDHAGTTKSTALTLGAAQTARVRAINADGIGPWSEYVRVGDPIRYWLQLAPEASTGMMINWQREVVDTVATSIEYRKVGDASWISASSTAQDHPYKVGVREVCRVTLSGLLPATEYEWRWSDYGNVRYFKTLPATLSGADECKMIVAADINPNIGNMVDVMTLRDFDFIAIPGDWAYADGLETYLGRWDFLWDMLTTGLTLADGRVIPILPGIGNHEVTGSYGVKADAPYFHTFFFFPAENAGTYAETRAGNWLSLIMLDSAHTSPAYSAGDDQLTWLASKLSANAAFLHRIMAWHVPYYPARRSPAAYGYAHEHLEPVLEAAGIRTAFTGHAHCYHRTHRIKAGVRNDAEGVKYFGEGCWGVGIGTLENAAEWYVEAAYDDATKGRHFNYVTFTADNLKIEAVGTDGVTFHEFNDPVSAPEPSPITGFRLGGTTINKLYLGSTEIKKAYLGNTLIYDKTS